MLIEQADKVVVVPIIKGSTLESKRGDGLLQIMTSVMRMFKYPKGV